MGQLGGQMAGTAAQIHHPDPVGNESGGAPGRSPRRAIASVLEATWSHPPPWASQNRRINHAGALAMRSDYRSHFCASVGRGGHWTPPTT